MAGVQVVGTGAEAPARAWVERGRPVVGLLVIGLWLAWAVAAWWVEPRSVTAEQLRADVAAGQVVTYRVTGTERSARAWPPSATADGWDTLGLDETTGLPQPTGASPTGVVYWVEAPYAQTRHLEAGSGPVHWHDLVTELRAAGVPPQAPQGFQPLHGDIPFWPGWAGLLVGLGSILLVYRPTRATRWAWLWLTVMVPFGFGLLALAVGELARPSGRVATAAPGEQRLRGGRAFVLALVVGVLVSVTASQLSRSVGALWLP